ncbi:hypothetical protein [Nitrospira sp. KM1]|uniref:hypothetical protein n=1 Tax=Nitrospira sp. KM1 TaxID=1936990 RepID=UPI001564BC88|nr:hypothetical protein [Nitrospira sp. KM1]
MSRVISKRAATFGPERGSLCMGKYNMTRLMTGPKDHNGTRQRDGRSGAVER